MCCCKQHMNICDICGKTIYVDGTSVASFSPDPVEDSDRSLGVWQTIYTNGFYAGVNGEDH
jgi:hypothetical protein